MKPLLDKGLIKGGSLESAIVIRGGQLQLAGGASVVSRGNGAQANAAIDVDVDGLLEIVEGSDITTSGFWKSRFI